MRISLSKSNMYLAILIYCFSLVLQSCTSQMTYSTLHAPTLTPITDHTKRYIGKGFSALPPSGDHWYLKFSNSDTLVFEMKPGGLDPSHTLVASLLVLQVEGSTVKTAVSEVKSSADFPEAAKADIVSTYKKQARFQLNDVAVGPYGPSGSYCSRVDVVLDEWGNDHYPGVTFDLIARGFQCLDASRKFVVSASYSERMAKGSKPVMDSILKTQGEEFLKNVFVNPAH